IDIPDLYCILNRSCAALPSRLGLLLASTVMTASTGSGLLLLSRLRPRSDDTKTLIKRAQVQFVQPKRALIGCRSEPRTKKSSDYKTAWRPQGSPLHHPYVGTNPLPSLFTMPRSLQIV